jgi:zinc transporter, ZIP family
MMDHRTLITGVSASMLVGLTTSMGALFLVFFKKLSDRMVSACLGFGGGVMLAAASFAMIDPAFVGMNGWIPRPYDLGIVLFGIIVGALTIAGIDYFLPHEHFIKGPEGGHSAHLSRAWLLVLAIAIHNFPEGLAVGIGYGTGVMNTGNVITTGIILQDLPEGLIAAAALMSVGYGRGAAIGYAFLTGIFETVGGLVGLFAVQLSRILVPFGLCFSAGAMIYVVCHEVIPESFRREQQGIATSALLFGFMLMLSLERLFT